MSNQPSFILEAAHHGAMPEKKSVMLPSTQVAAQQNLFGEALLEATSTHQKRGPLKWAVSMGAHVAVLAVLLLMPLYFSQGLDLHRFDTTLLTAPLPPMAAPPPPPAAIQHMVHEIPKTTFTPGKLTAPSFVPKIIAAVSNEVAPPDLTLASVSAGVPGGITGGQVGGVFGGTGPAAPAVLVLSGFHWLKSPCAGWRQRESAPPSLGPAAGLSHSREAVSHRRDIVVIEAIIDEHGNVTGERAISGRACRCPQP